jgi:hypothetical protein
MHYFNWTLQRAFSVATRLILGRGGRNRFDRGKELVENVRTEQVVSPAGLLRLMM